MKILIAGLGSIGRRHLRNLVNLGQRDLVLYRTGQATLPDAELSGFETVRTLEAGLAQRPKAVIVSNPTALHLDVAIPAAQAGCHLLIEKPVSDSTARGEALRRAVAAGRGRVLVGFQFRHHPTLQQAKRLVEEGRLGGISSARVHWGEYLPGWHPWEAHEASYAARRDLGGGALLTLCHPFDYLRWIFGEVASARGVFGEGLGLEVEAVVEAGLRFRSGVAAGVHLDYLQRPAEHFLEVIGEAGRLRWDGLSGTLEVTVPQEGRPSLVRAPAEFERNSLFVTEMEHFLQVVEGSAEPVCGLDDGLRVQEILEEIRFSATSDTDDRGER